MQAADVRCGAIIVSEHRYAIVCVHHSSWVLFYLPNLRRGQGHLIANDFVMAAADLQKSVQLCSAIPIAWAAWGVALFKIAMADSQVMYSNNRIRM